MVFAAQVVAFDACDLSSFLIQRIPLAKISKFSANYACLGMRHPIIASVIRLV